MEIKPILAAHYTISYRIPGISGSWGRWQFLPGKKPAEGHHQPDHILANGEHDIASVYMPVIGPYDSGDPDLCEYHILLAKSVGCDAFLVDWHGHQTGGVTEKDAQQLETLLRMAEKLEFAVGLCFNDGCCFPEYQPQVANREQAIALASEGIRHIKNQYMSSPAYLRINGRPVLTIRNCGKAGRDWHWPFFTRPEWDRIVNGPSDILLIQNYQMQRDGIDFTQWDSVYPWVSIYFSDYDTDETFWENSHHAQGKNQYQFTSGLVNAGYDDRAAGISQDRTPRVFSRRQGEKYSATWEDNLHNGAQFIQIGTWNNHAEGTGIEPVKEIVLHKNAAVPGWGYRELITTREYAVRFTKKKLWPLPSLFLPERLYRLRKSGAPAGRGDRIRLYLLEGDITGSTLGLEHAGV
ncbi:hypothetical protein JW933_09965 [candidate division FCPU426 bacterium]|nr:hypothetical protein [candidate division FCPU426 bacterium]